MISSLYGVKVDSYRSNALPVIIPAFPPSCNWVGMSGFNFPLQDAAGEAFLELNLQAQPAGPDRIEGDLIEAVYLHAVRRNAFDRFPGVSILVEQFPGCRDAAAAGA